MEISNKEKEYHYEPHMVYSCQYHVIFCPKYRRNVLQDGIDVRLRELILEKQDEYQYKILEMNEIESEILRDFLGNDRNIAYTYYEIKKNNWMVRQRFQ